MSQKMLSDSSFFPALYGLDGDIAAAAGAEPCQHCGGPLHVADYPRKPRGLSSDDPLHRRRFSFCCARDGCRKRRTPPSVRFLGRKVYASAIVVLAAALVQGWNRRRLKAVGDLGVSRRTLERWRQWWLESVPETPFWRFGRGRFSPPVHGRSLPAGLLDRFCPKLSSRGLIRLLQFLAPLTTSSPLEHAWSWAYPNPQKMPMVGPLFGP